MADFESHGRVRQSCAKPMVTRMSLLYRYIRGIAKLFGRRQWWCNHYCAASIFGHGFDCLAVRFVQRAGEGDDMACTAVVEGDVTWYEGVPVCLCLVELQGMRKLIKTCLSDGDMFLTNFGTTRREATIHANWYVPIPAKFIR